MLPLLGVIPIPREQFWHNLPVGVDLADHGSKDNVAVLYRLPLMLATLDARKKGDPTN